MHAQSPQRALGMAGIMHQLAAGMLLMHVTSAALGLGGRMLNVECDNCVNAAAGIGQRLCGVSEISGWWHCQRIGG